jgi:hypothetical protein
MVCLDVFGSTYHCLNLLRDDGVVLESSKVLPCSDIFAN